MQYRILTAVLGLPVLISAIILGLPWLSILVGLIAFVAASEFINLAVHRNLRPFAPLTIAWTASFIVVGHFVANGNLPSTALGYTFSAGLIASLLWAFLGLRRKTVLLDWSYTVGGAIYVGWFLSYALLLRSLQNGWQWALLMLIGTFATDTSSFFIGRAMGKHKIAPSISPGKTWEGAIAGLAAAMLAVPLLTWALGLQVAVWQAGLLGAVMGVAAQAGDLLESKLKRLSKVKDAGGILPGHGGILDRLDSVVFNIVIVYYFAIWTS